MSAMVPVGRCGLCGGVVSAPEIWHATIPPPMACETCGAGYDPEGNLPVLPMLPKAKIITSYDGTLPSGDRPPELSSVDLEDWNNLTPEARKAICEFVAQTRRQPPTQEPK